MHIVDFGHRTTAYFQSTNTFRFQTMSDLSAKTKVENVPRKFNKNHPKAEVKTAVSAMENLSNCSQLFSIRRIFPVIQTRN